ncbi:MAG: hypothetical protein LAN59_01045 [Acidobacteriia bacterium]|nr:hypothetical protein [Terriglobia bacterium]
MTHANRQFPIHRSGYGTATTVVAGTLILAGIVFQWGEISGAHPNVDNLWYISVILNTIGRTLQMCFTSALLQDAFKIWPLALVTAGVAMLLSAKRTGSPRVPDGEHNA